MDCQEDEDSMTRTTPRTISIYLDPKEARCEPVVTACDQRDHCARYQAVLPKTGAMLEDFSTGITQNFFGAQICYKIIRHGDKRCQAPRERAYRAQPPI